MATAHDEALENSGPEVEETESAATPKVWCKPSIRQLDVSLTANAGGITPDATNEDMS